MRWVAFEYLRYAAETRVAEMVLERSQQHQRCMAIAVNTPVCLDIRSDQPGPDRTLVIGSIAACRIATVRTLISGVIRTERSQPKWSEKMAPHRVNDASGGPPLQKRIA